MKNLSETQQKEVIENSTHPQTGITPEMANALRAFLFGPQIWPRYRTAPASTAIRFHHAYEGGLLYHSSEVVGIGLRMREEAVNSGTVLPGQLDRTDIVVVGLLHDLHKIGDAGGREYFLPNLLKNGSRSDKIPYMSSDVAHHFTLLTGAFLPVGSLHAQLQALLDLHQEAWSDGMLSLSVVAACDPALYSMISGAAKFAIIHHAGMYDRKIRHELDGKETPLQVLMHFADMLSSRREQWSQPKET